jgi:hypothetical protein
LASLETFLGAHEQGVVEGCYGEFVGGVANRCTVRVVLKPGEAACLANNLRRPWEPHKYSSIEEQDSMLQALQAWVSAYYTRDGSWSYREHRRIFDGHRGPKVEHTEATDGDEGLRI